MSPSCTVLRYSKILVENRQFEPTQLYLVLPLGVTPLEFSQDLWHQKTKSPWAIVWHCLHDPTFSRFGTILACDKQTDKQTDRRTHDDSIHHASIA